MSTVTGGKRTHFIWDSTFYMIHDALDALGWFDRNRDHSPINFTASPTDNLTEIPPNTITLVPENTSSLDIELGSILAEKTYTFWVDMFMEDELVATVIANDISDILEGRMASAGRTNNWVTVFDYTTATPTQIFSCEIINVELHRGTEGRAAGQEWRRNWHACAFDLIDTYADESDTEETGDFMQWLSGESIDWSPGDPIVWED